MLKLNRFLGIAILVGFLATAGIYFFNKPEEIKSGCIENLVIGKTNLGLEITLCHVGGSDLNSDNSLLIIGSIHGNEKAGKKVVDELIKLGAPKNTDLWVIRDANPDGAVRETRQNENGVDLNRNFPTGWFPSEIGTKTYSGTSPASELETHALMQAIDLVKPKTVITIHQPYGLVDCSKGADENLDERLAKLTGLPAVCIPGEMADSPTNTYTGTITQWVNNRFPNSTAIALELEAEVNEQKILKYAVALHNLS